MKNLCGNSIEVLLLANNAIVNGYLWCEELHKNGRWTQSHLIRDVHSVHTCVRCCIEMIVLAADRLFLQFVGFDLRDKVSVAAKLMIRGWNVAFTWFQLCTLVPLIAYFIKNFTELQASADALFMVGAFTMGLTFYWSHIFNEDGLRMIFDDLQNIVNNSELECRYSVGNYFNFVRQEWSIRGQTESTKTQRNAPQLSLIDTPFSIRTFSCRHFSAESAPTE